MIRTWNEWCHMWRLLLALLDFVSTATVVAQASVVRPSVVRPSVRVLSPVSQKPPHGSRPNFMESYLPYLQTLFFFFSKFLIFKFLLFYISFSATWDIMGANISKRYFSHSFGPISTNFMITRLVMGGYRLLRFWRSAKK